LLIDGIRYIIKHIEISVQRRKSSAICGFRASGKLVAFLQQLTEWVVERLEGLTMSRIVKTTKILVLISTAKYSKTCTNNGQTFFSYFARKNTLMKK